MYSEAVYGIRKMKVMMEAMTFMVVDSEPLAEEIGHGACIQMLGHDPGASAQDVPREEGSYKGVAKPRPGRGQAEVPAELSGISHEYDRRKIEVPYAKAVSQGPTERPPRTNPLTSVAVCLQ